MWIQKRGSAKTARRGRERWVFVSDVPSWPHAYLFVLQLFHRRRNLTFFYPLLERQRQLLDELGPDGMSSDEERGTGPAQQYDILVPAWRSRAVTAWLRVFDYLYITARRDGILRDYRGSYPRSRVHEDDGTVSASRRFVPRLPRNAYDEGWLRKQVDAKTVVRPRPDVEYYHDPKIVE